MKMDNSPFHITGITSDSREVKKGFAFVAIKGLTVDGHDFIDNAIHNGAELVYGEKDLDRPKYFKVTNSRQKLAELARDFYDNPSSKLKVIGVTGTKGKTTTVHLIHHMLTYLGYKTGLISSVSVPGFHVTNPDVVTLNKMLNNMVKNGCKFAVLEVSSHGIDQGRTMGINFEVGVLTNIAPEHLDYHKTFQEYKRVKMSFINSSKLKVIAPSKSELDILPGEFNNINLEAAIEVIIKLGLNTDKAMNSLMSFILPEGRMYELDHPIAKERGLKIFIDFAHTPDSLDASLKYLRSQTTKRLISVFGCAGERDRKKRRKMGIISTQYADLSIFTAEDPRTENIYDILRSMKRGLKNISKSKYISIPERGEAVAYSLNIAHKGDLIAFMGKGHEKSMAYSGIVNGMEKRKNYEHPWSDKNIIISQLNSFKDISIIILAAGKGTRMKSQKPKVLREVCGRPILAYTLENLRRIGIVNVIVVVGFRKNLIQKRFPISVDYAIQKNPKAGTADATKSGLQKVENDCKYVVVINGDDSAFYTPETIKDVIVKHKESKATLSFVSLVKSNPAGLGRVVRDERGKLKNIIEEKDATEEQRSIQEINDGLYVFDKTWLDTNIKKVKKGQQGEFYLVDLIKIAVEMKDKVNVYKLPNDNEWHGINTPDQLVEAEEKMKLRLAEYDAN